MGTPQLNEGDIYFWRWKEGQEPRLHGSADYAYWCRSQKAIVRKGLLLDTYWGDMSSDRAIDPERVELEYKGNEGSLRPISEWEMDYYEPEDVVGMGHANNSRARNYVQPEAQRSPARITEYLNYIRSRALSTISNEQSRIERIDEALVRVAAGQLDGGFP